MAFHIPASAKSWINYDPDTHFPIQNIPFGVFVTPEGETSICTRIGDHVLDLSLLANEGVIEMDCLAESPDLSSLCLHEDFPGFSEIRKEVYGIVRQNNPKLRDNKSLRELSVLGPDAPMIVPMEIGAFVDFYSGINHARNVGMMFRPDGDPLLPNYRHIPIGYNGRASSVVVSGEPIYRPSGQTKAPTDAAPKFGPSRELDFELELGFFLQYGTEMGQALTAEQAEQAIAGYVLVNDWSARDLQRWEYQPLGPFLAKSFATSISPWLVTTDALQPFRGDSVHTLDPEPLPYLRTPKPAHYSIELEVWLKTAQMRQPQRISATNANQLYFSTLQQLLHQSSNGTPSSRVTFMRAVP